MPNKCSVIRRHTKTQLSAHGVANTSDVPNSSILRAECVELMFGIAVFYIGQVIGKAHARISKELPQLTHCFKFVEGFITFRFKSADFYYEGLTHGC